MKSLLLLVAFTASLCASSLPELDQRIRAGMQSFVDKGTLAGAVTLVMHRGSVASLRAVGYQDIESRRLLSTDALFQIHSMTKPMTAVGAMILVEAGLIALSDPVEKYLPEFRGQWVISRRDDRSRVLSTPTRVVTLRDLMTHTSGMGDYPEAIKGLGDTRDRKLSDAALLFSQSPLEFNPGERWLYSSVGINALGRVIEVVSGQPLDRYLDERIFKPLGMRDTCFFPPREKYPRIPIAYEYRHGKLQKAPVDLYRTDAVYASAAGGVFSTASDLASFCQMMLAGGSLKEKRILSRAAVETMTSVHIADLPLGNNSGREFGLGWSVVRGPAGALGLESIGSFGHGGAWGTQMWVDPTKDLVAVFLTHRTGGGNSDERNSFYSLAVRYLAD